MLDANNNPTLFAERSMTLNQPTQQQTIRQQNTHSLDVAEAVQRGEFVLSLSTMLGCDYIFISHKGAHELLETRRLETTLRELLDILETSPHQSMIVSADETSNGDLVFTRYDYKWENRQVLYVVPTRVTRADQIDFMQMMFDCSTTC
ncbi:MAG TPA: hypothetical protein VLC79_03240 [Cellvibrio sp.]|nr:hypothetical protein [Cellvibrio sp.]